MWKSWRRQKISCKKLRQGHNLAIMLHAMIMAGGGGTRFWPRSRAARPKQFLALAGDRTLVQQACDRLEAQVPPGNTWVITSQAHVEAKRRQLPHLQPAIIDGEPSGRGT